MPKPDKDQEARAEPPGRQSRVDQAELVARLTEELRAADDRADMLTNAMQDLGHGLNNALSAIDGFTHLIEVDTATDARASDVREIDRAAAEAREILSAMVFLGGRMTGLDGGCDLAEIVAKAVANAELGSHVVRLRIVHSPTIVAVGAERADRLAWRLLALIATIYSVADRAASLDIEVRSEPPPGSGRARAGHARVRLSGAFSGDPLRGSRSRSLQDDAYRVIGRSRHGAIVTDVSGGRVTLDWWLPLLP